VARGRTEVHEITSASESADVDLQRRKIRYMLSMALRIVLFPTALFLHGPLRWVALAIALVMPAIAVVLANTKAERRKGAGGRSPDQSAVVPLGPTPRTGH
jgi:hypothetical protein